MAKRPTFDQIAYTPRLSERITPKQATVLVE